MSRWSMLLLALTLPLTAAGEDTPAAETPANVSPEAANQANPDANTADNAGTDTIGPADRVLPDPHHQRHLDIVAHLQALGRDAEIVPLVAAQQSFSGLFLPQSSGRPQGGVLLLHDRAQHGHWPAVIGPLREYLPEFGWSTLAIELPIPPKAPKKQQDIASNEGTTTTTDIQPPAVSTPAATSEATAGQEELDSNGISLQGTVDETPSDNEPALPPLSSLPELPANAVSESTPEPEPIDIVEQYRQQVRERIAAAMDFLTQRGQYNLVIIANGISASWAVDFLLDSPIAERDNSADNLDAIETQAREPGHTLVLIDPLDDPYSQSPLIDQLEQLDIRILDLLTDLPSHRDYDDKRRAGAMRRRQRQQYEQIHLPAVAEAQPASSLMLRRVRGWLRTHAAGVEVGQRP